MRPSVSFLLSKRAYLHLACKFFVVFETRQASICSSDCLAQLNYRFASSPNKNVLHDPAQNFLVEHKGGISLRFGFCGAALSVCGVWRTAIFKNVLRLQCVFVLRI